MRTQYRHRTAPQPPLRKGESSSSTITQYQQTSTHHNQTGEHLYPAYKIWVNLSTPQDKTNLLTTQYTLTTVLWVSSSRGSLSQAYLLRIVYCFIWLACKRFVVKPHFKTIQLLHIMLFQNNFLNFLREYFEITQCGLTELHWSVFKG